MLKKIVIILATIMIAVAGIICLNGWHIDYVYASPSETETVDYKDTPETVSKPVAYVRGKLFLKDGFEIESKRITNIDTSVVGEQKVEYQADFLWLSETAEQTIMVVDSVAPTIKLTENENYVTEFGDKYIEEGYIALDDVDGDITNLVSVSQEGDNIIYSVKDFAGNLTTAIRTIEYVDTTPPSLTLQGKDKVVIQKGNEYKEDGFLAVDKKDGDITEKVEIENKVDVNKKGTYEISYSVSDEAGNVTSAIRTVVVEDKNVKTIYLTFDDGPGPYTNDLLDILAKYDVKATFFVVGNLYPDVLERMYNEGHAIGAHSLTHDYKKIYSSEEGYFKDLNAILDVIENATGARTNLIRFPGGSSNSVSKAYNIGIMGRLAQKLNEEGYTYFDWNVSSGDAGETKDTKKIFENITKGIEQYKAPVVLQHDTKDYSVAAVEDVIVWALEKGYEFGVLTDGYPIVKHKISN